MTDGTKHNPEILRAQDIIPSSGSKLQQDCPSDNSVPQFDLATEIMAQQRRLTSSRRKGPENKVQTLNEEYQTQPHTTHPDAFVRRMPVRDAIIAEIVQRDIHEMLLHSRQQA